MIMLFILMCILSAPSQYRMEIKSLFESKGFETDLINSESYGLIKTKKIDTHIVYFEYVNIRDDNYVREVGYVDCKKRLTKSEFSYESHDYNPEIKYVIDSGWETFTHRSLQEYFFKSSCYER